MPVLPFFSLFVVRLSEPVSFSPLLQLRRVCALLDAVASPPVAVATTMALVMLVWNDTTARARDHGHGGPVFWGSGAGG